MTPEEVARLLRVPVNQLRRWRLAGTGPRALRLGGVQARHVRYLRSDVDAYLAQCAEEHARDQAKRAKADASATIDEATP